MSFISYRSLAFALALSVVCRAEDIQPLKSMPPPLSVVHTFGDLRGQKPVTISAATPSTYRLGIDCNEAKLYGGCVLYCLGNDAKPVISGREGLGPFRVEIQSPSSPRYADLAQSAEVITPMQKQEEGAEILYLKSIPFHQAGEYIVTVQKLVGEVKDGGFETVGSAHVKVAAEPGPLWSPWPLNAAGGAVGILARDDDPAYSAEGVVIPSAGVSVPKMPLSETVGAQSAGPDGFLPQLMPTDPDPGVKLQVSGALLIVTLNHGIPHDFPDEKFLSRWWVNGKPFTPKLAPTPFSMDYEMRHNGAHSISDTTTEIVFQVEYHPEILGAKKGDTIGVQLLLCPHGSEYSGPEPTLEAQAAISLQETSSGFLQPRMSNRVTFIYTGDPVRMAPLAVSSK